MLSPSSHITLFSYAVRSSSTSAAGASQYRSSRSVMVFNVMFSLGFQALHVYGVFLGSLSGPFEPSKPPPVFSGPLNLVCRLVMVASLVFMMGTPFIAVQNPDCKALEHEESWVWQEEFIPFHASIIYRLQDAGLLSMPVRNFYSREELCRG